LNTLLVLIYNSWMLDEKISSKKTEALFVILTGIFALLFAWRLTTTSLDCLSVVWLCLGSFFLFYSLNYRTLHIQVTTNHLLLKFGIFSWTIALDHVEDCFLDDTSLWRIGGAGIHFSPIHGRYRAMFNFLEYPRVVVALKHKLGLVRDIAFSTQHPAEMIEKIRATISINNNA
jgi:hypothetical protein